MSHLLKENIIWLYAYLQDAKNIRNVLINIYTLLEGKHTEPRRAWMETANCWRAFITYQYKKAEKHV